jgi:hypothetical protein
MRKLTLAQIAALRPLSLPELHLLYPLSPEVISAWLSHPDAPQSQWNAEAIELEMFRIALLRPKADQGKRD